MEYAIVFLPLIGSIFGYLGRSITKFFSEIFTSLLVSISAILSIIVFWNGVQKSNYGNYQIIEWISSGDFIANWSINIDPLSSVMLIVVTFVSALVHIYSIGYMSHDPHKPRFMSYLSLGAIIFFLGILGIFLNRKNVIVILMSIELILLAVNINLISFSIFSGDIVGQIFTMLILTIAAAEAAIGLAIILIYYRNRGSIRVEDIHGMKG